MRTPSAARAVLACRQAPEPVVSLLLTIAWSGRMHGVPVVLAQPRFDDRAPGGPTWDLGGARVACRPRGGGEGDLLVFALEEERWLGDLAAGRAVALLPPSADDGEVSDAIVDELLDAARRELGEDTVADPRRQRVRELFGTLLDRQVARARGGDRASRAALHLLFDPSPSRPLQLSWWTAGGSTALGRSVHHALVLTRPPVRSSGTWPTGEA
jgi:hypothetical protein